MIEELLRWSIGSPPPSIAGEGRRTAGVIPRNVVYDFYRLPYSTRWKITHGLGLHDDDGDLPDAEQYKRWFERAGKRGLVAALADKIKEHIREL